MTPTPGRTRRPASLPIKAGGDQSARIAGRLDRFDAQNTLIDVYGFTLHQALQGRPRGGEYLGTAFPDARGEWELATRRRPTPPTARS